MTDSPASRWPWLMLPLRTVLFAAFQALFALGFLLAGSAAAWNASANWWPFAVTAANVVCIALLIRLYHREDKHYWGLFRFQRETVKSDLLALLGILIISEPIAFLPNLLAANWLFGNQQTALDLFIRPLPAWAAYASLVIFLVTIALAELPTYFAYVMPRLAERTGRPWLAVLLAAGDVFSPRADAWDSPALAPAPAAVPGYHPRPDGPGDGGHIPGQVAREGCPLNRFPVQPCLKKNDRPWLQGLSVK